MMATKIEAGEMADRWCILRTSGGKTLPLARSLADADFDVWTPTETRERLAGRRREPVEQELAILSGYVFARERHLPELLTLARSPSLTFQIWDKESRRMVIKGYPYFSVFHENGRVRPQTEKSLAPLRALEESLAQIAERRRGKDLEKGIAPRFTKGQIVRAGGGAYEGLHLTVAETNRGKSVKLTHPDWFWPVEISAWKLENIQVEHASPTSAAVLAA